MAITVFFRSYSAPEVKPLGNVKACGAHYVQVLWESEGSHGKSSNCNLHF